MKYYQLLNLQSKVQELKDEIDLLSVNMYLDERDLGKRHSPWLSALFPAIRETITTAIKYAEDRRKDRIEELKNTPKNKKR